jgi:hypothetical protein
MLNVVARVTWFDLDIQEQIGLISGLLIIIALTQIGVKVFTNIWVKNGYAGKDKILVDSEVSLYISHVLAYCAFVLFVFLITFRMALNIPSYVFAIDSSMFMSAGAYAIYEKIRSKMPKHKIKHETKEEHKD